MKEISNHLFTNYIQSVLDGYSVGKLLKLEMHRHRVQDGLIFTVYKCRTAGGRFVLLEFEDFLIGEITAGNFDVVAQLGLRGYDQVMLAQRGEKGFVHRRNRLYFLCKTTNKSLLSKLQQ